MSPQELRTLYDQLQTERTALIQEGAVEVRVEAEEPVASKIDEDAAPLREMGQAIASARNRERTLRLRQIDGALQRIAADPDEFGLCAGCGEEIPPRRLALLPWVTLCVDSQSGKEEKSAAVRKKVTDYR